MVKKGEILNQLAIISDLLENINLETQSKIIVIELSKTEFEKAFNIIQKKYGRKMDTPKDSFNISIGTVDIVFNMSNV